MTNPVDETTTPDEASSEDPPISADASTPAPTEDAAPSEGEGEGSEGTLLTEAGDSGTPEPFDPETFEWPEEAILPEEYRDAVAKAATEHGVSTQGMNSLLSVVKDMADAAATDAADQWTEMTEGWRQASVEKYGDEGKASEAAKNLAPLIDEFGGDDFKKALTDTGLGNHPAMFGFLEAAKTKVTALEAEITTLKEALGEGSPVNPNGTENDAPDDPYVQMYPNMPKDLRGDR